MLTRVGKSKCQGWLINYVLIRLEHSTLAGSKCGSLLLVVKQLRVRSTEDTAGGGANTLRLSLCATTFAVTRATPADSLRSFHVDSGQLSS